MIHNSCVLHGSAYFYKNWELTVLLTYYRRVNEDGICGGCAQAAFNELVSRNL